MKSLLIALFCLTPLSAFAGDPGESVIAVYSTWQQCHGSYCTIARAQGSGVIIGERDGRPVVATCHHVVKEQLQNWLGRRCSVTIRGKTYSATVIGWSTHVDIALLRVDMPLSECPEPLVINEDPRLTAAVEVAGFPRGRWTRSKAKLVHKVKSTTGYDELVSDRPTDDGQSGGALLSGDELAGIVHGTNSQNAFSTPGNLLAETCRHYKVKLKLRVKVKGPVVAPPPPPPAETEPQTGWCPDPANTELLKQILQRMTALEAKAAVPGPAGPSGPQGPAGPPGKDATADLSKFEQRLSVLEKRSIVVQLVDETGKTVSEQAYAPGSPIRLQHIMQK